MSIVSVYVDFVSAALLVNTRSSAVARLADLDGARPLPVARQGGSNGSPRMYLPRQNNNVGLLV